MHPALPANKELKHFLAPATKTEEQGISSKKPLWSSPPPVSTETIFSKILSFITINNSQSSGKKWTLAIVVTGRKLGVTLEKSKSKIKCLYAVVGENLCSHWGWKRCQRQPVSDTRIGRFYPFLRSQTNISALSMGAYILHKATLIAGLIVPSLPLLVIQTLHRRSHMFLGGCLYDF